MYFRKYFTFLLIPIIFAISNGAVQAQLDTSIYKGQRVRVTAPSIAPRPITGNIKELQPSLVIVKNDSVLVQIQRNSITKIELSMGKRNYVLVGALIGTCVGLAVGQIASAKCRSKHGGFSCFGWIAAIPSGAAVGTIVGIIVSGEGWKVVELNHLQFGVADVGQGKLGLRMALSF